MRRCVPASTNKKACCSVFQERIFLFIQSINRILIFLLYMLLLVFKVVVVKKPKPNKEDISEANEPWIFQSNITPVLCQYAL